MPARKKTTRRKTGRRNVAKTVPVQDPAAEPGSSISVTEPTTISDFPDEILLHIIGFNVAQDFQHLHKPSQTIRYTAQVCQRWRAVTIGCPAFWAESLDFVDPIPWIYVVLERSQFAPINVVIPSVTKSVLADTASHSSLRLSPPRIGDLIMRWDCKVAPTILLFHSLPHLRFCRDVALKISGETWAAFNTLIFKMSNLESLTLVRTGSDATLAMNDMLLCHPILFSNEAPPWKLRSLDLRGCGTSFAARAFHQLEELTVHDVPSDIALDPAAWLTALKDMKSLRRLELVNATSTREFYYAREHEQYHYSGPVLDLPNLEWFKLDAPLRHCSSFLSYIALPSTCNLSLTCGAFASLNPYFHSLMTSIEGRFDSKENASLGEHLQVAITPNSCVVRAKGSNGLRPPQNIPSFDLTMRWYTPTSSSGRSGKPLDPQEVFCAITLAIHRACESVIDLDLSFVLAVDPAKHLQILTYFLRPFVNLRALTRVTSPTLAFLLPFFQPLEQQKPKEDVDYLSGLLPALDTMSFYAVDFTSPVPKGRGPLGALVNFVHSRSRKDAPEPANEKVSSSISDMRFVLCNAVGEKTVKRLECAGVQVLRDGFSCGFTR